MVTMKNIKIQTQTLIIILAGFIWSVSFALDNPDSPDLTSEFEKLSTIHDKAVDAPGLSNLALISAYHNYQLFLDKELNKAYKRLKVELPKAQQQELEKSQKNWIKFRDAEFEFITNNWTHSNFGSSIYLSRGLYKNEIIKNRILQLLSYAQNY